VGRFSEQVWGDSDERDQDFVSKWFADDREVLDRSLRRFVGVEGYGIESLRGDLERFIFLLGGDGEALFGPDSR
jgi:hypothetical protein